MTFGHGEKPDRLDLQELDRLLHRAPEGDKEPPYPVFVNDESGARRRRHRALVAVCSTVLVFGCIGGGWFLTQGNATSIAAEARETGGRARAETDQTVTVLSAGLPDAGEGAAVALSEIAGAMANEMPLGEPSGPDGDGAGPGMALAMSLEDSEETEEPGQADEATEERWGLEQYDYVESRGIPSDPFDTVYSEGIETPSTVEEHPLDKPIEIDIRQGELTPSQPDTTPAETPQPNQPTKPKQPEVEIPVFTNTEGEVSYPEISGKIAVGSQFGTVTIPRMGIENLTVRWGGQPQIDIGLCQYDQYDLPGSQGVSMMCAHNYNKNWKIGQLKVGDRLYYDTVYGQYIFEVYNAWVNNEGRPTLWLKDSYYRGNSTDMLLMTCYPFNADGLDGRRYLVACRMVAGPEVVDYPATDLEKYGDYDTFYEKVHGDK